MFNFLATTLIKTLIFDCKCIQLNIVTMRLTSLGLAPSTKTIPLADTAGGIELRTLSPVGITRTELPTNDTDYSFERERAINKLTPDGLQPVPHDECKAEHKLTKKLFKKYASNIFNNAISFPIAFSEPRSYLERCADLFSFLVTKYIDLAHNENDKKTKLALIATGIIAGFHIDLNPKKVFNPYLGETYAGIWSNGTEIFAEQTSHHPPISDFLLIGPDNSWRCYAHADFDVDSGMNQVEVKQNGIFKLEMQDGTNYEWVFPSVVMSGFMKGDKTIKIKGELNVYDVTNNLICTVEISPKKNLKRGIEYPQASTIYGGVRENDRKIKIGNIDYDHIISGDYCYEILYDGEKIWDISSSYAERPSKEISESLLLPSDSRFRLDRVLLIQNDLVEADKAKNALEEIQRREEKLRDSVKKHGYKGSKF
ncbi:Oxysterol binding protein [Tritrichomonas foetus]|uniref:Oxysterol binding protein n=1 Tax=Tritrichomonas foetus TaxID=1144522 RepID=A0A1J4J199_9EUKA|nr:Oxysterol binding protein [Tritrichomonas foetus]|eukprot:OHS93320.1 Oxysterol binding protein [Tritrichomonas foetus]